MSLYSSSDPNRRSSKPKKLSVGEDCVDVGSPPRTVSRSDGVAAAAAFGTPRDRRECHKF